jgi:hypothetical protein
MITIKTFGSQSYFYFFKMQKVSAFFPIKMCFENFSASIFPQKTCLNFTAHLFYRD